MRDDRSINCFRSAQAHEHPPTPPKPQPCHVSTVLYFLASVIPSELSFIVFHGPSDCFGHFPFPFVSVEMGRGFTRLWNTPQASSLSLSPPCSDAHHHLNTKPNKSHLYMHIGLSLLTWGPSLAFCFPNLPETHYEVVMFWGQHLLLGAFLWLVVE
jgi:hypothetical protein